MGCGGRWIRQHKVQAITRGVLFVTQASFEIECYSVHQKAGSFLGHPTSLPEIPPPTISQCRTGRIFLPAQCSQKVSMPFPSQNAVLQAITPSPKFESKGRLAQRPKHKTPPNVDGYQAIHPSASVTVVHQHTVRLAWPRHSSAEAVSGQVLVRCCIGCRGLRTSAASHSVGGYRKTPILVAVAVSVAAWSCLSCANPSPPAVEASCPCHADICRSGSRGM